MENLQKKSKTGIMEGWKIGVLEKRIQKTGDRIQQVNPEPRTLSPEAVWSVICPLGFPLLQYSITPTPHSSIS
jgi:hypothetical protein